MINIPINKEILEKAKQEYKEDINKLLAKPDKDEFDYKMLKLYKKAMHWNDFSDMSFFEYEDTMNELSDSFHIIKDDKKIDGTKFVIAGDYNDHYFIQRYSDYELKQIPISECKQYNYLTYGVCDNASQILNHYEPKEDEVVLMVPIIRKFESEIGGWRWHKWGSYIGVQNPSHEYIYDDKDIDVVFCFTIYKILHKEENNVI